MNLYERQRLSLYVCPQHIVEPLGNNLASRNVSKSSSSAKCKTTKDFFVMDFISVRHNTPLSTMFDLVKDIIQNGLSIYCLQRMGLVRKASLLCQVQPQQSDFIDQSTG